MSNLTLTDLNETCYIASLETFTHCQFQHYMLYGFRVRASQIVEISAVTDSCTMYWRQKLILGLLSNITLLLHAQRDPADVQLHVEQVG